MSGIPSASAPDAARVDWHVWALILALAAFLRLYGLGNEPLWLDEGYSWWDARQSLGDLWSLVTQCDPHPPLYAALLKLWTPLFGDSPAALRGLGAAAGVGTTLVVMLAGREISSRVAWIAGLLTALSPFQIEFAHEARPYAIVAFGAALVVFGVMRLLRSLEHPVDLRPGWLALVLGTAIALWSNNTSVLLGATLAIAFLALFALEPAGRKLLRPVITAGMAVALLWAPYLPIYLAQAHGIAADFWIPKPDLWRVGNELRFVLAHGSFEGLYLLATIWLGGLVALWRAGRHREAGFLAALVVLPVALNFAVSVTVKPIFLARALIGIAPPFAVAIAAAIAAIDTRFLRLAAVGGLAAARLASAAALYTEHDRKEQWDDIASYIVKSAGPDALVLLVPNELALPLGHALEDANAKVAMRGVPVDFPAPGRNARYPSGKCTPSVVGQDLSPIAQAARDRRKVVIVTRHNNVYDPNESTQALLRSLGMKLAGTRDFNPGFLKVQTFVAPTAVLVPAEQAKATVR